MLNTLLDFAKQYNDLFADCKHAGVNVLDISNVGLRLRIQIGGIKSLEKLSRFDNAIQIMYKNRKDDTYPHEAYFIIQGIEVSCLLTQEEMENYKNQTEGVSSKGERLQHA